MKLNSAYFPLNFVISPSIVLPNTIQSFGLNYTIIFHQYIMTQETDFLYIFFPTQTQTNLSKTLNYTNLYIPIHTQIIHIYMYVCMRIYAYHIDVNKKS